MFQVKGLSQIRPAIPGFVDLKNNVRTAAVDIYKYRLPFIDNIYLASCPFQ